MNATSSDEDSDYNIYDASNFIAFPSRSDVIGGDGARSSSSNTGVDGPSKNTASVTKGVPTLTYESNDDEHLIEEELIHAYRLIHTKWTELTKICEKISAQTQQSNIEKNNLQKLNSEFESKLKESQDNVATLKAEIEKLKKSLKMLNSGSSTGRIEKEYFGLGYTRQTGSGQTVFVKDSASGVNKEEVVKGKRSVAILVRAPTVMKSGKASIATLVRTPAALTSIATPGITTIALSGRMKEKRWIPICHYCNRI